MLIEIVLVVNLAISLFVAYKLGTMQGDIEILYEGLAQTMQHTGMSDE